MKKIPSSYKVYITKDNSLVKVADGLTRDSFFELYFTNIRSNAVPGVSKKQLLDKYNEIWKAKGIKVIYVDSWGHEWEEMPSQERIDAFLNNIINE